MEGVGSRLALLGKDDPSIYRRARLTSLVYFFARVRRARPFFPFPAPLGRGEASAASTCGRMSGKDRKSTRLNSSHTVISYAVFCLKTKKRLHDAYNRQNHLRDAH